mmetsp:Transcript_72573/g.143888  ORF Transcript_72573/g.143888 Transcript_72573/m.143888 type:complete len:220 (+) Transcript_72573:83-742(+)
MSWDRGAPTPVVPNSHQARDARETGPLWACTCGSFNAASLSHCTKCGSLKPIERALRLQARAIQGLGRGGGYFERGDPTDRRKAEDEAEDKGGFDIYGRRRFAHSENTDERGEDATTSDATASVATAPEGGEAVDTASKNDAHEPRPASVSTAASASASNGCGSKADRQRAALERLRNPTKLKVSLSPPRTRAYREPSSRSRERKQRRRTGFIFSGGIS